VSAGARYLLWYAAFTVSGALLLALLVCLVDPLWYWGGNKFGGPNYAFNERLSKSIDLGAREKLPSCLVLGSSLATMLRPSHLPIEDCYNFAFSDGRIEDFLEFGRYHEGVGIRPAKIIVGVDFDFRPKRDAIVPQFVTRGGPPPTALQSYLSHGSVLFSLRTVAGLSPMPRYYDHALEIALLEDRPTYVPPACRKPPARPVPPARTLRYGELLAYYAGAESIGVVLPVSAWVFARQLPSRREIGQYAETMKEVSRDFDRFFDFSVPSHTTRNSALTYDGVHYLADVNENLLRRALAREDRAGLEVTALAVNDYAAKLDAARATFLAEEEFGPCPETSPGSS